MHLPCPSDAPLGTCWPPCCRSPSVDIAGCALQEMHPYFPQLLAWLDAFPARQLMLLQVRCAGVAVGLGVGLRLRECVRGIHRRWQRSGRTR